jgi:hypothetical protein
MRILAEQQSIEYYELRAIEEIRAARHMRTLSMWNPGVYRERLILATRLILLAHHETTKAKAP